MEETGEGEVVGVHTRYPTLGRLFEMLIGNPRTDVNALIDYRILAGSFAGLAGVGAVSKCRALKAVRPDETNRGESIPREKVRRQGHRIAQYCKFKWKRNKRAWKEEGSRSERQSSPESHKQEKKAFRGGRDYQGQTRLGGQGEGLTVEFGKIKGIGGLDRGDKTRPEGADQRMNDKEGKAERKFGRIF